MRSRRVFAVLLTSLTVVLAGCGVRPSSVMDGGHAPTGVASGTPVYYVSDVGELVVDRRGEKLGTIGQALKRLIGAEASGDLRSYVPTSSVTLAFPITRTRDVITIMLPLERARVPREIGIDQIVCTVLAVHQQSGGPASTTVRLSFVQGFDTGKRHCPVLPTG